jgi:hypothetical protein
MKFILFTLSMYTVSALADSFIERMKVQEKRFDAATINYREIK